MMAKEDKTKTKIRLHNSIVQSILIYGADTWTISYEEKSEITGCRNGRFKQKL